MKKKNRTGSDLVLWEGLCDKERFKLILKEAEGSTWQKQKQKQKKRTVQKVVGQRK